MFFLESQCNDFPNEKLATAVAEWLNSHKLIVSPATSRRRLTSMREYAASLGISDFLPRFKLPDPGMQIPHPLPGLDEDLKKMLGICKTDKQRCLVALLGLEGLRLSEALNLSVIDLNLSEMTIRVWGKGDKVRVIPITRRAEEFIYPQLIITQIEGLEKLVPYSDRGARNFITELGCAAQVSRPVASHDLRATFATLAYRQTHDIRLVQAWLGHSDVSTTQVYIQTTLDDMRRVGEF